MFNQIGNFNNLNAQQSYKTSPQKLESAKNSSDPLLSKLASIEQSCGTSLGGITQLYSGEKSVQQYKMEEQQRAAVVNESCAQYLENLEEQNSFAFKGISDLFRGNINTTQFKNLDVQKGQEIEKSIGGYLQSLENMGGSSMNGLTDIYNNKATNNKLNLVA